MNEAKTAPGRPRGDHTGRGGATPATAATTARDAFRNRAYGPAPESDELAMEWLQDGERTFGHWIGGVECAGEGALHETRCPADGRRLGSFRYGDRRDVESAVAAAWGALGAWQSLGGHGRARHLYRLSRRIHRHARLFAVLESLDNGKTIRESRDLDVPLAVRHFQHHAGWAELIPGEFPGYEALGVIGQIIPWNFPLLMLAWKVAPALAAGNTVVLKPAEYTPLTALLFAEIAHESGLPPGVLNVVTGDGTTGAGLVRHPKLAGVAFTGSTSVGREIRRVTAGRAIHLSLELGGKSPFVVFESADLDAAVEGVVDGVWLNQGEVCCAGSRLLVHESVEERMHEMLRARMERIRVGHPLDKGMDMGAIVAQRQVKRIEGYLRNAAEDGARVLQPARDFPVNGCFVPPTLCTGAPPSSRVVTEEIFGPVLVSQSFRTPAEAVALANDTRYGLAASLWTEDLSLAMEVAPRIGAGTVWINCTNRFDAAAGFGGYRESGFGREGGREGMREYLKPVAGARGTRARSVAGSGGGAGAREGTGDEGTAQEAQFGPELSAGRAPAGGVAAQGGREGQDGARGGGIDRTRKLWIGGRQRRPDGGHSLTVRDVAGAVLAEIPRGNRKDVRDAVEAAARARAGWAASTAYLRSQILYFVAENLAPRAEEFAGLLSRSAGMDRSAARAEVEAALRSLFTFAAWADKHDGRVHATPFRNVTLAMNEAVGTVGIRCAEGSPLAGVAGPIAAALAQGNVVVALPCERYPLPALELVQILETSDIPPGTVNIVSGLHREVLPTLAAHDDVEQLWDFAGDALSAEAERLSAGNLKRTWVDREGVVDWRALSRPATEALLAHGAQVKNVWVPYGV